MKINFIYSTYFILLLPNLFPNDFLEESTSMLLSSSHQSPGNPSSKSSNYQTDCHFPDLTNPLLSFLRPPRQTGSALLEAAAPLTLSINQINIFFHLLPSLCMLGCSIERALRIQSSEGEFNPQSPIRPMIRSMIRSMKNWDKTLYDFDEMHPSPIMCGLPPIIRTHYSDSPGNR